MGEKEKCARRDSSRLCSRKNEKKGSTSKQKAQGKETAAYVRNLGKGKNCEREGTFPRPSRVAPESLADGEGSGNGTPKRKKKKIMSFKKKKGKKGFFDARFGKKKKPVRSILAARGKKYPHQRHVRRKGRSQRKKGRKTLPFAASVLRKKGWDYRSAYRIRVKTIGGKATTGWRAAGTEWEKPTTTKNGD